MGRPPKTSTNLREGLLVAINALGVDGLKRAEDDYKEYRRIRFIQMQDGTLSAKDQQEMNKRHDGYKTMKKVKKLQDKIAAAKKKEEKANKAATKNQDGELKSPRKRKQNEMTPADEKQPPFPDSKNASLKSTTQQQQQQPKAQQQPTKSSNNAISKPPTSRPANSTQAHPIGDTDREQIAAVLRRKWQPFPDSVDSLLEAREHLDTVLAPLTSEQERMILQWQFGPGSTGNAVTVVTKGILFRNDLRRTQPGIWINDGMMVYYLKTYLASLDEEACKTDPERRRCHFLTSQFWKILYNQDHSDSNIQGKYAYKGVRTWRNRVPGKDVFSLDKLFIPINQGGDHWVFVVVFVQQKRIGFWDSFGEKGEKFLEGTLRYLCDEWRSMHNTSMDLSEWNIFSTETPRQQNSTFCLSFNFS
jgi:hypothetical protein